MDEKDRKIRELERELAEARREALILGKTPARLWGMAVLKPCWRKRKNT